MTTERELAGKLGTALARGQFADWRRMYTGRLTSTGVTLSGAADNKVWVRAEEDSREETQVWGSAQRINLPVWVGPGITGELEIKGVDQHASTYTAGPGAAASILPPITPENNPNLLIDGRQFKPGRLRLSTLGGLYVYIEPFHYPGGYWPGGDFELTPPATSSTQAWCGVAMNPADDTLYQFTGTEYALPYLLTPVELGNLTPTEGYIPCGAIVLENGQTTIDGSETIDDWRYHLSQAGGDITGFVTTTPASDTRNTVQPSGDHPALILKNNASQTDAPFQVQTSAGAVMAQVSSVGGLTVNEQGADADTRIEGDTDANLVFVDASTDRVGIGTNTPTAKLNVEGAVTINDSGADVDFRVEGDTAANLLFADASLDAIGINQASIAASAQLDVASTTKGVLIPRMTTTQRDAISSPATGLMIYNTSTSAFNFYNGSSWAAVGAGSATITVKEADGTPNVSGVSTIVVSNGTLTDDGGGQVTVTTGGGSGSSAYSLCQGRLTLTTGTPVTTSDVTAATTVYFTPYGGNQIGLYSGSAWDVYTFSEISLSLSGYTADKNYDIWVYNNSGTITLDSTVWTNDSTRATALTTQDGVYVKSGATTRRYVGTIRITGTTGQTEDSTSKRFVWNYYNRVRRDFAVTTATASWTYASTAWRQANASSAFQAALVVGVAEEAVHALLQVMVGAASGASDGSVGIGIDSTTTNSARSGVEGYLSSGSINFPTSATYSGVLAAGYHYVAWLEYRSFGTSTFYGSSGKNLSALTGWAHA